MRGVNVPGTAVSFTSMVTAALAGIATAAAANVYTSRSHKAVANQHVLLLLLPLPLH
jgi:hypothetical protein